MQFFKEGCNPIILGFPYIGPSLPDIVSHVFIFKVEFLIFVPSSFPIIFLCFNVVFSVFNILSFLFSAFSVDGLAHLSFSPSISSSGLVTIPSYEYDESIPSRGTGKTEFKIGG